MNKKVKHSSQISLYDQKIDIKKSSNEQNNSSNKRKIVAWNLFQMKEK